MLLPFFLLPFSLLSLPLLAASLGSGSPEDVMDGKIPTTDRRYATYKLTMDIMRGRNLRTLVETGTSRRGDRSCLVDGCSTIIFSRWADLNPGMTFYSVDNDPAAVEEAVKVVKQYNCTKVILGDSVQYLREFTGLIDFLYLDTMDFDFNNPRPSQEQPLREIIAAYPKLHEDSLVLVDDCGLASGGKCAFVEVFLKELGWRTVLKGYQLLMATKKDIII